MGKSDHSVQQQQQQIYLLEKKNFAFFVDIYIFPNFFSLKSHPISNLSLCTVCVNVTDELSAN